MHSSNSDAQLFPTVSSNLSLSRDISMLLGNLDSMTPSVRFEMVQQVLLDMQAHVSAYKSAKENAELKLAIAERQWSEMDQNCTKLRLQNSDLLALCKKKDSQVKQVKDSHQQLKLQLEDAYEKAKLSVRQEFILQQSLKTCKGDIEKNLAEIHTLSVTLQNTLRENSSQREQIKRLDTSLRKHVQQKESDDKQLAELRQELAGAHASREHVFGAALATRQLVVGTLDEAMRMNPNHFSGFDSIRQIDLSDDLP